FNRIVSRLPAPSQVYWRASASATVTRVTGGEIWNCSTRRSVNWSPLAFTGFCFTATLAFGRSMTRRGGFASVCSAGGTGRLVTISIADPATLSRTTFTLLTAAGDCDEVTAGGAAGVVGSVSGVLTGAGGVCGAAGCAGTGEATEGWGGAVGTLP